jgi:hypothetical protein
MIHSSLSYAKTVNLWIMTGLFVLLAALVMGAILATALRINQRPSRMKKKLKRKGWNQQSIETAIARRRASIGFAQSRKPAGQPQTPLWEVFLLEIGLCAIIPLIVLVAASAIVLEAKYPIHKTVEVSYIKKPIPLRSSQSDLNPVIVADQAKFNDGLTATVKLHVALASKDDSGTEFLDQKVNYTKGFVVTIFANDIWLHEPNPVRACNHRTIYVTGEISQYNGYYEILNPTSIKILES